MQLLSKRITRRYTPPTCTLEVSGETSALSQWTRRPVLKDLQFHLSLDNPRQPGDQPIQIRGDRDQLEALSESVESYVQSLINHPQTLPLGLPTNQPSDGVEIGNGDGTEAEALSLTPQALLVHSLSLNELADDLAPVALQLSVTQLFDLATALEEYSAETEALPASSSAPPLAWLSETPIWAKSAAIALLAVGVSMAILELANQNSPSQLAQQDASDRSQPPDNRLLVPSPPAADSTLPEIPPLETAPATSFPNPPTIPSAEQLPSIAAAPQVTADGSQGAQPSQRSVAIQPQNSPSSGAPAKPPSLPPSPASDAPLSIAALRSPQTETATGARSAQEKLADAIPQVAQVRSYFQQRWQPPESLNQTLEYTLILNPDGSLARSVPLGEAASTYLDRTPIPLANEPFVSPPEGQGKTLIRLVLYPDGEVQTFLQPGN